MSRYEYMVIGMLWLIASKNGVDGKPTRLLFELVAVVWLLMAVFLGA